MKPQKNVAGKITEDIMAQIRERLPNIKTNEYNRVYEAVYSVLSGLMACGDNENSVVLAPNNDWAFMAKVTALSKEKKRKFYEAVQVLFYD